MQEKFSTNLEWDQITLSQIQALLEVEEMVRAVGLAKVRLRGLRKCLQDVQQVVEQDQYKEIMRDDWVKEAKSLAAEIAALEQIVNQVN